MMYYSNNRLCGIMCIHVDDFIVGGDIQFEREIVSALMKEFKIGSFLQCPFKFLGLNVDQTNKKLIIDQTDYISKIETIKLSSVQKSNENNELTESELFEFRALIGQLSWIAGQTRPDIAFDVCMLSTHVKKATIKDIIKLNKIVRKAKIESVNISFGVGNDISLCEIKAFADASFGIHENGGSHGGVIIFLCNKNGQCSPIMWQSRQIKRVVKSTMSAETLIQVECAEAAFWIKSLLEEILNPPNKEPKICIGIECITDNHQLYDGVLSIKPVTDKRLRIDLALIKEMINKKEISKLNWVRGSHQLANCLTKAGAFSKSLLEVFQSGYFVTK